jgi:HlyD family secretion protein
MIHKTGMQLRSLPRIGLVAALALAACAAGCSSRADAQHQRKGAAADTLPVSITIAKGEALSRTIVATGSIHPWQEAVIAPEVGGYRVAAVNVDVGDAVKKGQELVRLAADMLNAEVASKRAAHMQAQAQLVNATANLRRAESLKGSGAVSAAEQERLQSEELAARARVEAAAADEDAAKLKLRYTRVLSPDDGVVTSRTVVVGQIAQAGGEMLRLLRQNRIEWRAEVPEARMREISVGKTVRVTTVDGSKLTGSVRTIAPTVNSGTRTGLVYVDLPSPGSARAGMFARGEIETSSARAHTLPMASVVVRDGYSYVFVVKGENDVERRRIETGSMRDGRVEVTSGIKDGDRVVERGAGFLKDGDRISIVQPEQAVEDAAASAAGTGRT